MTALLLELPVSSLAMEQRNRTSVEVMLDSVRLPVGSLTARDGAVHVTVASLDDLAEWMYRRGGYITMHPTPYGVDLWILHTTADGLPGDPVQVRVSVPVAAGDWTPGEFTAFVLSDRGAA